MTARFLLLFYAAAWRLALGPLRAVVRLDRFCGRAMGRDFLPAHWLAARRLLDRDAAPNPDPNPDPARAKSSGGAGPPTIWLHAASLGESKGLWALAECLLEDFPPGEAGGFRLLLTAHTGSGLGFLEQCAAARQDAGPAVTADLAPLDHPDLVDAFLRRHRVAHVCLYEADLWPHYVLRASAMGIPVDLVSARMTGEAMVRHRRLHGVWTFLLDRMEWILAQGPLDAARLKTLTRTPIRTGGDFKACHYFRERGFRERGFRRGPAKAVQPDGIGIPHATSPSRIAFISLYIPELDALLPALPALMERFPLTVFPRLPQEMGAFRSRLLPLGFVLHGSDPGARHVLVDSLGKVTGILPACGSAFVGGSLVPRGCHNLWEPLLAGLKVYFGPSIHYQEDLARLALEKGVAEILREPSGMSGWKEPGPGISAACRELMEAQVGVLEEGEAAFRARMADVISRFYLFSGQPGADKRLPVG